MLELNMSIGYWGAAQLLGYLRIHWGLKLQNVFFFLHFWQEMLLNIYTALESQAVNFRS